MFGFCIEASHRRGMGHLYRALNCMAALASRGEQSVFMINNDVRAVNLLEEHGVPYMTVDLNDFANDWESESIRRFNIDVWINDRLDTDVRHTGKVKKNSIQLVTFDDRGDGAGQADLHFAPMVFSGRERLQGGRIFSGVDYLVLNPEIDHYKRVRNRLDSTLVTLGGSDTYGVSLRIVRLLKRLSRAATIVVGPAFMHRVELEREMDSTFTLLENVPSLISEFARHDLAITGGGVTPFEANASGLPCIIVANEQHEIETGRFLANAGASLFAGYYRDMAEDTFSRELDLDRMSRAGLNTVTTAGTTNVVRELLTL